MIFWIDDLRVGISVIIIEAVKKRRFWRVRSSPVRFLLLFEQPLQIIGLMKANVLAVLFMFLFLVPLVSAQETPDAILEGLEKAIGDGEVDSIVDVAGSRLDVSIFGEGKSYSRAQADFVLDQFFAAHHASSFRFTASSKTEKARFVEGVYYSGETGKPLQVYIRLQKRGETWELREFLVERARQ